MSIKIKRADFDFLAKDYKTDNPDIQILKLFSEENSEENYPSYDKEKDFIQRWHLSIQGEENPTISRTTGSLDTTTDTWIYRCDWAFGITLIEGFYWDWMKALRKESALAVHIILKPEKYAPEAIPISATLSTLHPSRNTKSKLDFAIQSMKTAADVGKISASTLPPLDYVSSGLMLGSNLLESQTKKQKNWFLYQFFDEKLKCPVVEWRISQEVLKEYGPLLRGTLFLAFYGSIKSGHNLVRVQLRPQIGYYAKSDITFITPTNKLDKDKQVFIDVIAK